MTVPVGLIARTIDGAIHAYRGKTRFSTKTWKTSEPLWENPFQDQDLVASLPEGSLGLLRMNYRKITYVSIPLCLKLFYMVTRIIIRKYFFLGKWRLGLFGYRVNGGTRLSYYNYTIEVKCLHIYFVVSVILHLDANLFYFVYLFIYI